jgi:hypothetical protein
MVRAEELERLRAVKAAHEAELMRKTNVVGVGIGFRRRNGKLTDDAVIVVSVKQKLPASQIAPNDVIPRELDGVPVDVQAVGELRAL